MPSYYTVIQYVPDPIADERINVGVLCYDTDEMDVRFLSQWNRVQHFGSEDTAFLRDFARGLRDTIRVQSKLNLMPAERALTIEKLQRMIRGWSNSIQFTTPRASLKTRDALLAEVIERFLVEPQRRKRGYRDRSTAVAVARQQIRSVLETRLPSVAVEELLRQRHALQGALDRHVFDAVVANGVPYFAAHALSFEVPDVVALKRVLDATAWAVDDVKDQHPEFPIAVIALPPVADSETAAKAREYFERAKRIFAGLGSAFLEEGQVAEWAMPHVERIPTEGLFS